MSGWWLVSYLVLWTVLALTLLVLLVVLRQLGLIYTQSGGAIRLEEGPALGSSIPRIEGVDELSGERFTFPDPEQELNLLVFVSPGCSICEEAVQGSGMLSRDNEVPMLVITDLDHEKVRSAVDAPARFMTSRQLHESMGIKSTPQAVVIDGEGVVLEKTIVNRLEHLQELLDQSVARRSLSRR
jgi:methylamine dehydrogenase accessory protein MauD